MILAKDGLLTKRLPKHLERIRVIFKKDDVIGWIYFQSLIRIKGRNIQGKPWQTEPISVVNNVSGHPVDNKLKDMSVNDLNTTGGGLAGIGKVKNSAAFFPDAIFSVHTVSIEFASNRSNPRLATRPNIGHGG